MLVGALSFSGRCRAVISEGMTFAHLVDAIDGVLRRLGGTPRAWRTDRMATVVHPGTRSDHGAVRAGRQALRRRGLGLPAAAPAAQGRRREGDPVRDPIVVADRARREPGPGAGRSGPVGAHGRRPPQAPRQHDRAARRPGGPARPCRRRRFPRSWRSSAWSVARRWSRSRATATASRPAWSGRP